jgi:hypothetical protein
MKIPFNPFIDPFFSIIKVIERIIFSVSFLDRFKSKEDLKVDFLFAFVIGINILSLSPFTNN